MRGRGSRLPLENRIAVEVFLSLSPHNSYCNKLSLFTRFHIPISVEKEQDVSGKVRPYKETDISYQLNKMIGWKHSNH